MSFALTLNSISRLMKSFILNRVIPAETICIYF